MENKLDLNNLKISIQKPTAVNRIKGNEKSGKEKYQKRNETKNKNKETEKNIKKEEMDTENTITENSGKIIDIRV